MGKWLLMVLPGWQSLLPWGSPGFQNDLCSRIGRFLTPVVGYLANAAMGRRTRLSAGSNIKSILFFFFWEFCFWFLNWHFRWKQNKMGQRHCAYLFTWVLHCSIGAHSLTARLWTCVQGWSWEWEYLTCSLIALALFLWWTETCSIIVRKCPSRCLARTPGCSTEREGSHDVASPSGFFLIGNNAETVCAVICCCCTHASEDLPPCLRCLCASI